MARRKATTPKGRRVIERRKQVNFLLRDIDSELWEAVKKRAGMRGDRSGGCS